MEEKKIENCVNKRREELIRIFEIPETGVEIIDQILTPQEQEILLLLDKSGSYSNSELQNMLIQNDFTENAKEAESVVRELFRRGVLNRTADGEEFCAGTFYGRLDIFATDEVEAYDRLSREQKERLDEWYFGAYLDWINSLDAEHPTDDEVLPLDEVLDWIDRREDTPYLADCDCRRLIQNCDNPVNTCITYRTAPNSFVKRGLLKPITKEEVKEVVRRADRQGLIHTVNSGGICSCCTDCCYLFRAAQARDSVGVWPAVTYQVQVDSEKCVNCKACIGRCRFSVLGSDGEKIVADTRNHTCVGCGLCVTVCPTDALSVEKRENEWE